MAKPRIGIFFGGTQFLIDRQFWAGATAAARQAGACLSAFCGGMLGDPRSNPGSENRLFNLASQDMFDALVAWTGEMSVYAPPRRIADLLDTFRPGTVVCAASAIAGHAGVSGDNFGGMQAALRHLIEVHDRRHIAFIRGPDGHAEAEERYKAYLEILEEAGLPHDARLICPGNFDEASGRAAARRLLDDCPGGFDAVVGANDPCALGAMRELQAAGIAVPDKVSVIGFDDREDAACSDPGLTTVRYSFWELGFKSVELAAQLPGRKGKPRHELLDMPLVARQSCGCADPREEETASWYDTLGRMKQDNAGGNMKHIAGASPSAKNDGRIFHQALLDFEREQDQVRQLMEQATIELDMDNLAATLPGCLDSLGIKRFQLWLFEDAPHTPDSRMKLIARDSGASPGLPVIGQVSSPRQAFDRHAMFEDSDCLVLPLCFREELLGLLCAEVAAPHVRVLETLKGPLARSLKSALLLKERDRAKAELERAYARVSLINELGSRMTSLLDVDKLLQSTADMIRSEFEVPVALVWLLPEPSDTTGRQRALDGYALGLQPALVVTDGAEIPAVRFSAPDQSVAPAMACRETKARVITGKHPEERSLLCPGIASRLCIPLEGTGRILGVLDLQTRVEDSFDPETVAVLCAFARFVASALRNANLYSYAKQAQAEAETANRMKSRFLSSISHELRTPLNAVINFSYLLAAGSEGELSPGQKELVQLIESSGRHLLNIINNVLDLAKIEAGKMELKLEPLRLPELANEAVELARGLAKDKPLRLVCDLPEQLPPIRADRTRILQIILNLLSNAVKYTDRGEVRLYARPLGQDLVISVSDSGPGIEPEELDLIFSEFGQLRAGAARSDSSGLGLPIARRLAELHGGSLTARSAPGKGSTFTLVLPVNDPAHTA